MAGKINILAISGSTRKSSSNLNLIKAITDLATEMFTTTIFDGLSELPHFNPDLDNENVPQRVTDFRRQLREADGIIICSPEYAIGVPGTLKMRLTGRFHQWNFQKKQ